MCTYTDRLPELQIAKEDIIVYKYVNIIYKPKSIFDFLFKRKRIKYFESKYTSFKYKPHVEYKTILDPFIRSFKDPTVFESGSGFYSFKDVNDCCNVKCIIPKGSEYFLVRNMIYGYYDQWIYHSDRIIILGCYEKIL